MTHSGINDSGLGFLRQSEVAFRSAAVLRNGWLKCEDVELRSRDCRRRREEQRRCNGQSKELWHDLVFRHKARLVPEPAPKRVTPSKRDACGHPQITWQARLGKGDRPTRPDLVFRVRVSRPSSDGVVFLVSSFLRHYNLRKSICGRGTLFCSHYLEPTVRIWTVPTAVVFVCMAMLCGRRGQQTARCVPES